MSVGITIQKQIAPVLQVLLDKHGIQWALRTLAISNFVIGIPVACVVRHRPGYGYGARRNGGVRINIALVKRGTFLYQVSIGKYDLSLLSPFIIPPTRRLGLFFKQLGTSFPCII